MNPLDFVRKFYSTLPAVLEWIEKTLEDNRDNAIPVIDLHFPRLGKVFPTALLSRAKSVVVTGKVPFPPLSRMGLPEFAQMEKMPMAGITYKDMFFINHLHQTESIYFHELVHVVQWDCLGADNFLLAYGAGLMQFGYQNSPLEQMAYTLQEGFERLDLPDDMVDLIRRETNAIWGNVAPLFSMQ